MSFCYSLCCVICVKRKGHSISEFEEPLEPNPAYNLTAIANTNANQIYEEIIPDEPNTVEKRNSTKRNEEEEDEEEYVNEDSVTRDEPLNDQLGAGHDSANRDSIPEHTGKGATEKISCDWRT